MFKLFNDTTYSQNPKSSFQIDKRNILNNKENIFLNIILQMLQDVSKIFLKYDC